LLDLNYLKQITMLNRERMITYGVILALLLICLWQGCHRCKPCNEVSHSDTTWHRDTGSKLTVKPKPVSEVQIPKDSVRSRVSQWVSRKGPNVPIDKTGQNDTNVTESGTNVRNSGTGHEYFDTTYCDALELVARDFFATRRYYDSLKTKYGWVRVRFKVTENAADSIELSNDQSIPEVTNTIVKRRTQLYYGVSILGRYAPTEQYKVGFDAAGLDLTLKTKDDKLIGAGVYKLLGQPGVQYRASFNTKISFRRK
jgi:hypothetical protein